MSKIGNIKLSYLNQFNIAFANTYSNISSNINENFEDIGSYSMIATDNEGNSVRLSYCIKQCNGLYADESNSDVLIMIQ